MPRFHWLRVFRLLGKSLNQGHLYRDHIELFHEGGVLLSRWKNPETQQINANLILHSLPLSVLIFLFVFLSVCPRICVYSLTCGKYMF